MSMGEQLCRGDERPGRSDDVNMTHISQKSLPVPSDEAMVLKIPKTDPDRIQALDSISRLGYKNAAPSPNSCQKEGERGHGQDT